MLLMLEISNDVKWKLYIIRFNELHNIIVQGLHDCITGVHFGLMK